MQRSQRWKGTGARSTLVVGVLMLSSVWTTRALSQTADEEQAVMAPVHRLFDAMRSGDSAQARSVFAPFARLAGAPGEEGQFNVDESTIDRFIAAIGSEREEVWDERIWDWDVKVDGNLASVWVPYAFYRGEQLSHCGIDAFQLVRLGEAWKILHVIDTRRREGCTGPPR